MICISEDRFSEATENYEGFCTVCNDFTTGQCEPDARKYHCESCENDTVYGAEEALIMGLISFSEEEDE